MADVATPTDHVDYRRARFTTRLPGERLYTAAHFWLLAVDGGSAWRVGFTKFATRMLGDMVDYGFEVKAGDTLTVGAIIGWMEGFKAITDLYAVVSGAFRGSNPALEKNLDLLRSDPYGAGWLYEAAGTPEAAALDVRGYVNILNSVIDGMLAGESMPPEVSHER